MELGRFLSVIYIKEMKVYAYWGIKWKYLKITFIISSNVQEQFIGYMPGIRILLNKAFLFPALLDLIV